jgi:hypothetical protein
MNARRLTSIARVGLVAAAFAVLICASAAMAHDWTVQVSGIQGPMDTTAGTPGDPCATVDPQTGQASIVSNTMTGSLVGCWYLDTFALTTPEPDLRGTGTEHFVGCLDIEGKGHCTPADPAGTLTLTARFEFEFDAGREVSGRCQHQIVSGTGGFLGATGRIDFTDNVTNGMSAYLGHIRLARHEAGRTTAAAVTAAARRPDSMC